jgi:uncharacterized membrane protein YhaH (DUF805 family)
MYRGAMEPTWESGGCPVGGVIGTGLYSIFVLGVILPTLAVPVRRLHDIDK